MKNISCSNSMKLLNNDQRDLSLPLVTTLIICYTLGAGILSIPYIISKLGFITAIIVFVTNFLINVYSFILFAKLSKNIEKYSLIKIVSHHLGKRYVIATNIILVCIFITVETLHLIFGWFFLDFLLKNQFNINKSGNLKIDYLCRFIYCVAAFIIMFPLVIKKEISSLKHFTYIFLGLLFYCIFIFLIQGPSFKKEYINQNNFYTINFGQFTYKYIDYFSTIFWSFSCHSNTILAWGKMINPTNLRLRKTVYYGLSIELVIYLFFGFLSYYFYGNRIEEISILRDPLNNKDYLMKIGIFAYGLGLIISNGFVAVTLNNTIYEIFKFEVNKKNNILIGTIPIIIALSLTFIYPNILNILSIGGGIFCNLSYYVTPIILYYHTVLKNSNKYIEKLFIIILLIFLFFILFCNFAIKFV